MTIYYKGYKIRLYPNEIQEKMFFEHSEASKFIWNYMLDIQNRRKDNNERVMSSYDMSNLLKNIKKEKDNEWLNNVGLATLEIICGDLSNAYKMFFNKKAKHPKYKNSNSKISFPIRTDRFHFNKNETVFISKIGNVKIKNKNIIDDLFDHKITNQRISYVNNKWILSFLIVYNEDLVLKENENDRPMGIDVGIKEFATISYMGKQFVFHNINKSQKVKNIKNKIKHLQKNISRKYNANKNYNETNNIKKYNKIIKDNYYKLSNIRKNYIHNVISQIIKMNPTKIVVEDLSVIDMKKNKSLAEKIQEQYFSMFFTELEYKCKIKGIKFVRADRYYPSSKKCSCCGNIKKDLKLSDRVYKCEKCGLIIDRDYNASINLMNYKEENIDI